MSPEDIRRMVNEEVDRRLRALVPDLFAERVEDLSCSRREEIRLMALESTRKKSRRATT